MTKAEMVKRIIEMLRGSSYGTVLLIYNFAIGVTSANK